LFDKNRKSDEKRSPLFKIIFGKEYSLKSAYIKDDNISYKLEKGPEETGIISDELSSKLKKITTNQQKNEKKSCKNNRICAKLDKQSARLEEIDSLKIELHEVREMLKKFVGDR
jgi:hypothetical protein